MTMRIDVDVKFKILEILNSCVRCVPKVLLAELDFQITNVSVPVEMKSSVPVRTRP